MRLKEKVFIITGRTTRRTNYNITCYKESYFGVIPEDVGIH